MINENSDGFEALNDLSQRQTFGEWLLLEMQRKGLSINALAEKTGITYTGVWNIVKGNTVSPREETRLKLAAALQENVPPQIEEDERQASPIAGYEWADFTPSDLETVPEKAGIYVFYDITDRPVYVGKSVASVRMRVKDHQTRFWFKHPLVVRGAFLAVADADLCNKIEVVLIKFLGKHALLNVKGAVRDLED
ncbi:hypothetical protein [Phyllobacterium endophyticum]|uniref:hypothetical protein n=1 Tax=Phyllobacterium endophyticum TaxID=1149773 RepID=UPI001611FBB9|nr:hypothetical protein [Phyllobacterium endophyticum]MBB3236137.1 transcriptional regulator with XRE-family HTH domain [Phyllobacterium endophyticum]